MDKWRGFTLIEVLVAIVLVSTLSIALLKQQWQLGTLFYQAQMRADVARELTNNCERVLANQPLLNPKSPFHLEKRNFRQGLELKIHWIYQLTNNKLQRFIVPTP